LAWLGRAGILTYEEELKRRGRTLPAHVALARQNLSHAFHCVLPFDFATIIDASCNALIISAVVDDREKLNQKIDILQLLQEVGISLGILHETSLPLKHGVVFDRGDADVVGEAGDSVILSEAGDKGSKEARMRLLRKALCAKLTPLDKRSGTRLSLDRLYE
jgi:hypothetical protein